MRFLRHCGRHIRLGKSLADGRERRARVRGVEIGPPLANDRKTDRVGYVVRNRKGRNGERSDREQLIVLEKAKRVRIVQAALRAHCLRRRRIREERQPGESLVERTEPLHVVGMVVGENGAAEPRRIERRRAAPREERAAGESAIYQQGAFRRIQYVRIAAASARKRNESHVPTVPCRA